MFVDGWDKGVDLATGLAADAHGKVSRNGHAFVFNLETLKLEITLTGNDAEGHAIAVLAGDYWLALARTRAEEAEKIRALSETPIGIQHHYCFIGRSSDGTSFDGIEPADKRRLHFPALSCLQAGDVGYDNQHCIYAKDEGAGNVQEALDALCARLQPPYHVLRMSQGTGQEAPVGSLLPGPVEVIVEDQDGLPVEGVDVTFAAREPVQGRQAVDRVFKYRSMEDPVRSVTVKSGLDGRAQAFWQVNVPAGYHWLEATLDHPVAGITFAAEAKARDFPRVEKVEWKFGDAFLNDETVILDIVARGVIVVLSEPVIPELVTSDVFRLTAEVPHKVEGGFNFVEKIICGTVEAEDCKLTFTPNPDSLRDLFENINRRVLPVCTPKEGMRFRIKLFGRFILSDKKIPLDGYVPGVPQDARIALNYMDAGLGHPSDFEAWFYTPYIK